MAPAIKRHKFSSSTISMEGEGVSVGLLHIPGPNQLETCHSSSFEAKNELSLENCMYTNT